MAGGLGRGFEMRLENNFAPTVRKFRSAQTRIVPRAMAVALRSAQKDAISEARKQLKTMVYAAPAPESVVAGRVSYAWYAQNRRLGRVWNAIVGSKVEVYPGGAMADVKVDQHAAGFENYYYAWILNKGGMGGAYAPRPFWSVMVKMMRARMKLYGHAGLLYTKAFLINGYEQGLSEDINAVVDTSSL